MSHAELLTRRLVDQDPRVVDHSARVTDLALKLATELDAPPQLFRRLATATARHDIGKLDVDPAILAKPGPLDDAEAAEIRRHPVSGTADVQAQFAGVDQGCDLRHRPATRRPLSGLGASRVVSAQAEWLRVRRCRDRKGGAASQSRV